MEKDLLDVMSLQKFKWNKVYNIAVPIDIRGMSCHSLVVNGTGKIGTKHFKAKFGSLYGILLIREVTGILILF